MSQYDELMDLVITEDTIEEYKERRSLQEGVGKAILGTIAALVLGPYALGLILGGIIFVIMKIVGNKKDKVFQELNKCPEFKDNLSKLTKKIQTDINKETKYGKYLKANTIGNLNSSNADILNNYESLCVKSIISIDMEKIWKDNYKEMDSQAYLDKHNNPDDCPKPPKEVMNVFKDIKEAVFKCEKANENISLDIDNEKTALEYSIFFDHLFNKDPGINLYIKIKELKTEKK